MFHPLPSFRAGLVAALLLISPTLGRVLPRQNDASSVATVQPTTTFAISVSSTPINAPTLTFSSNVTTTAAASTATASSSSLPPKYYKLVFSKGWVDTNGNPREAILVNGQTPGPLIEAEEGQELIVSIFAIGRYSFTADNLDVDRSNQPAGQTVYPALSRYLSVVYSLGGWSAWCDVSALRLYPYISNALLTRATYSQYPIDPGATYTYTYTPLQHGQYW